MRMRDQDDIHRRQVADPHSRLAQPFQHEQPARKIGIDDGVLSCHLHKKAGMPDEGQPQFAIAYQHGFVHGAGSRRNGRVPDQFRERTRTASQRTIIQGTFDHLLDFANEFARILHLWAASVNDAF